MTFLFGLGRWDYRTFKELSDKFNAVTNGKYDVYSKKEVSELANSTGNEWADKRDMELQPDIYNSDILKQIEAVKVEKIPKERDTSMGRKVWVNDQYKRIKELEAKLR